MSQIFCHSTEIADWQESNCFKCKHYDYENPKCKLEIELCMSMMTGIEPSDLLLEWGVTKERGWKCNKFLATGKGK